MIVAAAVSIFLQVGGSQWSGDDAQEFAYLMLTTVGVTTVAWLAVTLLTPPEPREKLVAFYRRVRPAGAGWAPIAASSGPLDQGPRESLAMQFVNWCAGCVLIYASLFGIGKLIFKEWTAACIWLVLAVAAGVVISRNLSQADWQEERSSGVEK
jgi:hypothetical protein